MEGRSAVPSQISLGYRARPRAIVSSKAVYTNIYDEIGTMGHAVSYTVVVQNPITNSYLRITLQGATKYLGRTIAAH